MAKKKDKMKNTKKKETHEVMMQCFDINMVEKRRTDGQMDYVRSTDDAF